jgi:hypothetical protein
VAPVFVSDRHKTIFSKISILNCSSNARVCEWTHVFLLNLERLFLYFYQFSSMIFFGKITYSKGKDKCQVFKNECFEEKAMIKEDISVQFHHLYKAHIVVR